MSIHHLRDKYYQEVVPALQKELGYSSPMQVPRILKVCINQGLGQAVREPKLLETAMAEMTLIAGQKPVVTKAKKAVANFKLRAGQGIGVRVTLRRTRMWDFLSRLILIAGPRIRDFQGFSRSSFDGQGNYTVGLKEQTIFPEIRLENVQKITGMDVTLVIDSKSHAEACRLLETLGFPLAKK